MKWSEFASSFVIESHDAQGQQVRRMYMESLGKHAANLNVRLVAEPLEPSLKPATMSASESIRVKTEAWKAGQTLDVMSWVAKYAGSDAGSDTLSVLDGFFRFLVLQKQVVTITPRPQTFEEAIDALLVAHEGQPVAPAEVRRLIDAIAAARGNRGPQ